MTLKPLTMRIAGACRLLALPLVLATGCEPPPPPEVPRAAASETDFPWPVPLPSTSLEIPANLHAPAEPNSRLKRAGDWLSRALREVGYSDFLWYDVPNGFALVTRLELIDDQGFGYAHPDPATRFSAVYPPLGFFTMRFWSQLLAGKTGRFRTLVFVVIDQPFGYCKDVTDSQIVWKHPSHELSLSRAEVEYRADYKWYALVYEVERAGPNGHLGMVQNPADPAKHLTKAGIFAALAHVAQEDAVERATASQPASAAPSASPPSAPPQKPATPPSPPPPATSPR
jgi:hypothetical protein